MGEILSILNNKQSVKMFYELLLPGSHNEKVLTLLTRIFLKISEQSQFKKINVSTNLLLLEVLL